MAVFTRYGNQAAMKPAIVLSIMLLAACASKPPPPDWRANAKDAADRFVSATLEGDSRVSGLEFAKARAEVSRTGRPEMLAVVELTRCAAQVASVVVQPCSGFDALRQDAAAPETAYAAYLAAKPQDIAQLPAQHRGIAQALLAGSDPAPAAVQGIADPFARLIAAGVLFQAGRASPAVIEVAVDTASAQGWQRPLLAWLKVQLRLAEAAGRGDEVARVQRRIEVVRPTVK
jgi:hypothetical protein